MPLNDCSFEIDYPHFRWLIGCISSDPKNDRSIAGVYVPESVFLARGLPQMFAFYDGKRLISRHSSRENGMLQLDEIIRGLVQADAARSSGRDVKEVSELSDFLLARYSDGNAARFLSVNEIKSLLCRRRDAARLGFSDLILLQSRPWRHSHTATTCVSYIHNSNSFAGSNHIADMCRCTCDIICQYLLVNHSLKSIDRSIRFRMGPHCRYFMACILSQSQVNQDSKGAELGSSKAIQLSFPGRSA